jgi:signal transduction histidine kinase
MTTRTGSDALVTALSHVAEAGLMLINPDGSIEFATERAIQLMCCGDLTTIETCPDWLCQELRDCLRQAKEVGHRNLHDEPMQRLDVTLDDPEQRDVLLEIFPVDVDSCEGLMVIVRDETERRQIVRDLIDATRMRNLMRLYRAVSHELQTPIASISIYLHLLRSAVRKHQSPQEEPDAQQQIETIAEELGNLDGSMQLLLDELTPSDGVDRAFVLRDHVLRATRLIDVQARQHSQSLAVTLSSENARVLARPERLRHALLNIAFYRLDRLGEGSQLTLQTQTTDRHAVITLADAGPPIAQIDRLFTRRHSADDDGTAIGLYVAWEVVRAAKGQLACESNAEQTRFTIRLPLTPHD